MAKLKPFAEGKGLDKLVDVYSESPLGLVADVVSPIPGLGLTYATGKRVLRRRREKREANKAASAEGEIAANVANRLGLSGAAKWLGRRAKYAPRARKIKLLSEPQWQPSLLKGKHFLPKKVRNIAAHAISHEPFLAPQNVALSAVPGSTPAYLAARGAAGKLLGVTGTAAPRLMPKRSDAPPLRMPEKTARAPKKVSTLFLSKEKRKAHARADEHFESDKADKWDNFLKNTERKSFVRTLEKDPRSDPKLKRHSDQMNRLLAGRVVAEVRDYAIVRKRGGGLGCTCPDWRYRRSVAPDGQQECKHIKEHNRKVQLAKVAATPEIAGKWMNSSSPSLRRLGRMYAKGVTSSSGQALLRSMSKDPGHTTIPGGASGAANKALNLALPVLSLAGVM